VGKKSRDESTKRAQPILTGGGATGKKEPDVTIVFQKSAKWITARTQRKEAMPITYRGYKEARDILGGDLTQHRSI